MESTVETLVEQAKAGDKAALEAVVGRIQDQVYNLALRMLWRPADAEDAAQEILIKVVTHLGDFRGESAFTTWVYRIAANHLLATRKRRAEREALTFAQFGDQLDETLDEALAISEESFEQPLLVEEVKIGCTLGVLLCLDRDHRLAYILGEVFEVSSEEGASILGITSAAFRKRFSRARSRIRDFLWSKCGVINPDNPCRCVRGARCKLQRGLLNPERLSFAQPLAAGKSSPSILASSREWTKLDRVAALFRSHPQYAAPAIFVEGVRKLVDSGQFTLLNE